MMFARSKRLERERAVGFSSDDDEEKIELVRLCPRRVADVRLTDIG